jgi:hypothetical protein
MYSDVLRTIGVLLVHDMEKGSRRKHLLKSSMHIETRGNTGNIASRSPAVCPKSRPSMDVVRSGYKQLTIG